jgi:hypothetical protein
MRIRVLGGGLYGCHLARVLRAAGHSVELHEIRDGLFLGASGNIPARLHLGAPHYPRSRLTRAACLDHAEEFMRVYGHLTRPVETNIYAVAANDSLVDFGTYRDIVKQDVECLTLRPEEWGLTNVEGALQVAERHMVVDQARTFFEGEIGDLVHYGRPAGDLGDPAWDMTIDATFCALDNEAVDRYEPCLTVLLAGPTNRSVTIVDGPFPSLYVWDERQGLNSLTSARFTPISKECRTWAEAKALLDAASPEELGVRAGKMFDQLCQFWPAARSLYSFAEVRTAIRAMPRSGADARLVDVIRVGERALRVRAGKIDAVFRAEALVKEAIACS